MKKTSILAALAAHAKEKTDTPALIDAKTNVAYGRFWALIKAFARELSAQGIRPGDAVMVVCTQDIPYMTALFACQLVGAVPVPVEKGAGADRLQTICAETQAKLLIGKKKPELPESVRFLTPQSALGLTEEPRSGGGVLKDAFSLPAPDATAEILFTTGTTGKPKGIVLTQANDVAIAENVIAGVAMPADNVEIIPMPLSHSHGLRRTFANLYRGSTAVLTDGVLRVRQFFDMIATHHVTAMDLSPAILAMLFKLSKDKLAEFKDQITYVQLGSAPLPEDNKRRLKRCLPKSRLYNFYGTTEAGCSCILDFSDGHPRENCIGRPTQNASFIFVDANHRKVRATQTSPGLIATAGAQNMKGYLNAPELTAATCHDGYLFTNDLGYQDADGLIYCFGRQGDVINVGGIKIAPDDIETAVLRYPELADCAVVPVADKIQGQVPKLFICLKHPQDAFDMAQFQRFLKQHLDRNKIPKQIAVIAAIPRTANGKVKRQTLMRAGKPAPSGKPKQRTHRARG